MSGGWNTIESDAGVFTYLVEKLGVRDVQFEELVTLEPEALQQLSPLYGIIFLFKYPTNEQSSTSYPGRSSTASQPPQGTYDHAAADTLFFASQVIQNACGTQALLSVLLNRDRGGAPPGAPPAETIDIGAQLREFHTFTAGFPAELRGEALSNSELIRGVHNSFARASPFVDETARAATGDDEVYHFVAYTPVGGTLYELDGLQPAPIAHGPCSFGEFPGKVVGVLQGRMGRYPLGEIRFNVLGMTRDRRGVAKVVGDWVGLEREEARRREWLWENALRRHNFLGFTREVLGAVVGDKVRSGGEEAYKRWVDGAVEETRRKLDARKQLKAGAT